MYFFNWIKFNLLLISDFLEILQLLKFDAKAADLVDNSEKIFENLFGLMLYRTSFITFFIQVNFIDAQRSTVLNHASSVV